MPSFDNSLTARLTNCGIPYQLAVDINAAIVAAVAANPGSSVAAILSGTINGASVGVVTPAVVKTSNLQAGVFTDISGVPGNGTSSGTRGRAAIAAAAASVVITSTLVTAASSVFAQLESADATLTKILSVVPGAGTFTVTGDAAATATTKFSFLVVN